MKPSSDNKKELLRVGKGRRNWRDEEGGSLEINLLHRKKRERFCRWRARKKNSSSKQSQGAVKKERKGGKS